MKERLSGAGRGNCWDFAVLLGEADGPAHCQLTGQQRASRQRFPADLRGRKESCCILSNDRRTYKTEGHSSAEMPQ